MKTVLSSHIDIVPVVNLATQAMVTLTTWHVGDVTKRSLVFFLKSFIHIELSKLASHDLIDVIMTHLVMNRGVEFTYVEVVHTLY